MFKRYYLVRKHDNYKEGRVIKMINPEDVIRIAENDPKLKEVKEELIEGGKENSEDGRQSVG